MLTFQMKKVEILQENKTRFILQKIPSKSSVDTLANFFVEQFTKVQDEYAAARLANLTVSQMTKQSNVFISFSQRRKNAIQNGRITGVSIIDHLFALSTYVSM